MTCFLQIIQLVIAPAYGPEKADKEKTVLLSEAKRDSEIIRGEGDKEAIATYAKAFNQSPDFYEFYRSMEAYRTSLSNDQKTLILSPESDFFKYLENRPSR